jgi:hypothetical protein
MWNKIRYIKYGVKLLVAWPTQNTLQYLYRVTYLNPSTDPSKLYQGIFIQLEKCLPKFAFPWRHKNNVNLSVNLLFLRWYSFPRILYDSGIITGPWVEVFLHRIYTGFTSTCRFVCSVVYLFTPVCLLKHTAKFLAIRV